MKEPEKIPLTDNPRSKEPEKIPLNKIYPEPMTNDVWDRFDTYNSTPVFAKKNNENNLENNSQSIQQLESHETD
jgi:hypothetical protein